MEEKEKKIDVNSLIEETPAETVDVTSLIDGGEKKIPYLSQPRNLLR